MACIIIDDEVAVIKGVVIFCISETLALATIGVKLPDKVVGVESEDVLCNSNTEEVTRGMANVPDKRFNVDEGVISLLFAETPTKPVEDVSATVEPTTWLCVSLTWAVMAIVCVNVTEGNPDCILEALAMSSVIFGVVDVDRAAL